MGEKQSSAGLVLLAWAVVSVPLGWGVYKTAVNAMKLFSTPAGVTLPPHSGKTVDMPATK